METGHARWEESTALIVFKSILLVARNQLRVLRRLYDSSNLALTSIKEYLPDRTAWAAFTIRSRLQRLYLLLTQSHGKKIYRH